MPSRYHYSSERDSSRGTNPNKGFGNPWVLAFVLMEGSQEKQRKSPIRSLPSTKTSASALSGFTCIPGMLSSFKADKGLKTPDETSGLALMAWLTNSKPRKVLAPSAERPLAFQVSVIFITKCLR